MFLFFKKKLKIKTGSAVSTQTETDYDNSMLFMQTHNKAVQKMRLITGTFHFICPICKSKCKGKRKYNFFEKVLYSEAGCAKCDIYSIKFQGRHK